MNDIVSQFKDAIRAAGMEPPEKIVPGKLNRYPGADKRKGNTAGWCILFEDGLGGCFGDWSTGLKEFWRAEPDRQYSQSEQAAHRCNVEKARKLVAAEQKQRHADAAKKATTIWEYAKPVPYDHPYLIKKGITPHGMRVLEDGRLIVPVCMDRKIISLLFITPEGDKKFMSGGRTKGGYCTTGKLENVKTVCIAESLATGASIHEATDYPVIIAFSAYNLESVAKTMRKKLSGMQFIICADDDFRKKDNTGLTEANKAARAIGAKLAIPQFKEPRPEGATDFNDMAAQVGLEAVARAINAAKQPDIGSDDVNADWPDPMPLTAIIEAESYPVDALPDTLRNAVEEVQAFVQAPVSLVASSALSALSLAIQAHVDVKRAENLFGPVSLFLLTIADSGERKTTCDKYFMKAILDYQTDQRELAKPKKKEYEAAKAGWEAKHRGIKGEIRKLFGKGKEESAKEQEDVLCDLQKCKPIPPREPRLIYTDITPEELKWSLAKQWPSGAVVSSEAGLVLGSYSMGKDSIMRFLATFNQLWDAMDIYTDRRTSESFVVHGARFTFGMQVQKATLRSFLERSVGLARGIGFLARFLIAEPESTQGTRFFSEPPKYWPALGKFDQRITEILEQTIPVDDDFGLKPDELYFSAPAKAAWVRFHDAIERELRSSGELYEVRDVASKTADNAARMSALFQYFEHGSSAEISLEAFEGASRIAVWHLHEAKRLYAALPLSEAEADVVRLDDWLIDHCQLKNTNVISRREVQQKITPTRLRKKGVLNAPLKELKDRGRVRSVKKGKRIEIHINPALLDRKPCNAVNRDKRGEFDKDATATPATVATLEGNEAVTVASVATVAVADSAETVSKFSSDEESRVRRWFENIGETDPAIIDEALGMCRVDSKARQYYLKRSAEVPK